MVIGQEKKYDVVHLLKSVLNSCRHLSSTYTPSSSYGKLLQAIHSRLCSLALLFFRRIPGFQALPLLLSFRQHHVVPGSQFSPGCPGLLWLHFDQVPQGLLGHMSCMSTSRFVHHYYKMDKSWQAAKRKRRKTKTLTIKLLVVRANFIFLVTFWLWFL